METYQRFLLTTTVVPGLVLGIVYWRSINRARLIALAVMMAMVYSMTPFWDHESIRRGYYAYDPERIWGYHVGFIPLEQFILYGTHTICLALMVWAILDRRKRKGAAHA